MREKIQSELKRIENHFNIKILYAAESGSRAWGFASADSDYDVRFVYIRNPTDYLLLSRVPDVIDSNNLFTLKEIEQNATGKNSTVPSFIPWDHPLDFVGWDLRKHAYACMKSNSQAYEWVNSPLVYVNTDDFANSLAPLLADYFNPKAAHYHYHHMGRAALAAARESLSTKKCLYALRCLLASHYATYYKLPVPVPMADLVSAFTLRSEDVYQWVGNLYGLLLQYKASESSTVDLAGPQWNILSSLEQYGTELGKRLSGTTELPDQLQPGYPEYNRFVKRQFVSWQK